MKISKNIIKSCVAGILTVTATSCSDFLDIAPLNDIVQDKFWNSESDVENIVAGCYSAMQSQAVVERMMAWGEFRSDNITGGTNYQNNESLSNLLKENITAKNVYTQWSAFYDIINRCNVVLEYAPQVAEKDPNFTESELKATEAEVTVLRDMCYFYLIKAFRDVPFSTEAYLSDTQKMDIPATPFYTVLDSLVSDLERVRPYAVSKYPTSKPKYQYARVTRQTINALLCEMYLWKKDYANCIRYADLIIDDKMNEYEQTYKNSTLVKLYNGFTLISDDTYSSKGYFFNIIFGKMMSDAGSFENIFELEYDMDETMIKNGAVSYYYGNQTTFPGIVKPADFISSDVSNELYKVFNDKFDVRYYANLISAGSSQYGISKYANNYISVQVTSAGISNTSTTLNYYAENNCYANWILYRLTDIMLLKAEALTQQVTEGDSERNQELLHEAFDIVSAINERACCGSTYTPLSFESYSSKTQMENLVMQERQRELMFEGKRWFDLVRRSLRDGNTNYLVSQVSRRGSDNASVVQSKLARMDAIFWPYNLDELKVNSNLKQNPAFGSGEDSSYEKN